MRYDDLRRQWHQLCERLGGEDSTHAREIVYEDLMRRYSEPRRHYHTIAHIQQCLAEFDPPEIRHFVANPDSVEMAIWFHDAVYDPKAHDNEERSAELAANVMRRFGIPETSVARVRRFILATRHHTTPADDDSATLVDIDLSILGQDEKSFDEYDAEIREEYAHVPEAAYRAGRANVLRGFLARSRIYSTEIFRKRYEERARANILRAIERLGAA